MGGTEGGAFKRMMRKLTSDVGTLDADDLSEHAEKSGAQRASDCRCGQDVTVFGRLRSVEFCPRAPTLRSRPSCSTAPRASPSSGWAAGASRASSPVVPLGPGGSRSATDAR